MDEPSGRMSFDIITSLEELIFLNVSFSLVATSIDCSDNIIINMMINKLHLTLFSNIIALKIVIVN